MRTEEYATLVRLIRELASEVRNVKTGLDSKIDHVAKKVTEAFQGFGILDPDGKPKPECPLRPRLI
mgnify:CR=1 FL=1